MLGNFGIAFFAGLGAAMWIYFKFSRRATGGELIKNLIPALLAGVVVFIFALTVLSAVL